MQKVDFNFNGLGIAPKIIETLIRHKIWQPTPIQLKAIPIAMEGKDLIGVAQTGTGKTLAFVIPIIQHLAQNQASALILVPTRELALQVRENVEKLGRVMGVKSAVFIGGAPIHKQIQDLAGNPRILIATPGRLIDLIERRKVQLNKIGTVVLDEADRMLDMGFAPQIESIIKGVPRDRQTLLFSATMPASIVKMAAVYMKSPVQVEIAPSGTTVEGVAHELFIVRQEMKKELLRKILAQYRGSVLLFCRTKIGSRQIARTVRNMGHSVAEIHSDRSLSQRCEALEGFRSGKYRILAATDIAARGIDVVGIELVINYDLPEDAGNYVHRIGRTGRAGSPGRAISFARPDQRSDVQEIERLIKMPLPISKHADHPQEQFEAPRNVFSAHNVGGRWRKFSRGRTQKGSGSRR